MRTLTLLLLCLIFPLQVPSQKSSGRVEGTVTQKSTGKPLKGVVLRLRENPKKIIGEVFTDDAGRYVFPSVAPGPYYLMIFREGWPATSRPVTVMPGQTAHSDVRLNGPATIKGRIVDDKGKPMAGLEVAALELAYSQGIGIMEETTPRHAITNNRGEYVLDAFNPGDYYIRAQYPIEDREPFSRTYFPGTIDASKATRLAVKEGAEVSANFAFQRVHGVSISGIRDVPENARGLFFLVPLDTSGIREAPKLLTNQVSGREKTKFKIFDVPPGSYDLFPFVSKASIDGTSSGGIYYTSRTRIEVGTRDITGLRIPLAAGVSVRGRIVLRRETPRNTVERECADCSPVVTVDVQPTQFVLHPNDSLPPVLMGLADSPEANLYGRPVSVGKEFLLQNIHPAEYTIELRGLSPDAYVADIRVGDRSVIDDATFVVGKVSPPPIEVVVSPAGNTIMGTISTGSRIEESAIVVLVPAPSRRKNFNLYRTAVPDDSGHFTLRGVAPGEYKLFAWEGIPKYAYRSPDYLAKYEDRGIPLNVAEPQSKISVPLIPKE